MAEYEPKPEWMYDQRKMGYCKEPAFIKKFSRIALTVLAAAYILFLIFNFIVWWV